MISEAHCFVTEWVQITNNVTKVGMGCGQSQGGKRDKAKEGEKLHTGID